MEFAETVFYLGIGLAVAVPVTLIVAVVFGLFWVLARHIGKWPVVGLSAISVGLSAYLSVSMHLDWKRDCAPQASEFPSYCDAPQATFYLLQTYLIQPLFAALVLLSAFVVVRFRKTTAA
ncbi:hypothetical protein [Vannielia sp.]|uniref:hypothetical protein n=1 Tax=Vannielia sp. TaxID=2813045 RepID=UPI00261D7009|nr:hypothetical protein [Vannielia sp.]MDF1871815.1 hypothetical protein [Vannielia sp.]